jgi:hypothetical protein
VPHSHCDPTWKQGFRSYYKSTVRDILEAVVRFFFRTHAITRGQRESGREGGRESARAWLGAFCTRGAVCARPGPRVLPSEFARAA